MGIVAVVGIVILVLNSGENMYPETDIVGDAAERMVFCPAQLCSNSRWYNIST